MKITANDLTNMTIKFGPYTRDVSLYTIVEHVNEINPLTGNLVDFIEIVIDGKQIDCIKFEIDIMRISDKGLLNYLDIIDDTGFRNPYYADYTKYLFMQKREPDSTLSIYMEKDNVVTRNMIIVRIYSMSNNLTGDSIYSMFKELGVNRLHIAGNFSIFSFMVDQMEDIDAIVSQVCDSIDELSKYAGPIEYSVNQKYNKDVTDEYLRQQQDNFIINVIADRLLVVPSNVDQIPDGLMQYDKVILNANNSYGDGRHPSTQLLIQWMYHNLGSHNSFLDVGAGNGLLSLYANILGCNDIGCCDNDVHSAPAIMRNCELNNIEFDKFAFYNNISKIDRTYNIISVNFSYNLLRKELKNIKNAMEHSSILLISGIHNVSIEKTLDTLYNHNMEIIRINHMDEWALIACKFK